MKVTVDTVRGPEVIDWMGGTILSKNVASEIVIARAKLMDGTGVYATPTGPVTTSDHLSSPHSTLVLISECYPITNVEDPPADDDEMPDDAVA